MQERSWRRNLSGPLTRQKMSFSIFGMRSVNETASTQNPTTVAGPLFFSVPAPNKRQEHNARIQYNLPWNHFLNVSLEYGTNSSRSLGEGGGFGGFGGGGGGSGRGVTLPERGTSGERPDPVDQLDTILAKGGAPLTIEQKQIIQAKLEEQIVSLRQSQAEAGELGGRQIRLAAPRKSNGKPGTCRYTGRRGWSESRSESPAGRTIHRQLSSGSDAPSDDGLEEL